MNIVPLLPSIPNYRAGLTIGTVQYLADVHWNGREEKWYFDLLTEDGEQIVSGVGIVLGAFLGRKSASALMPAVTFVAVDTSGEGRDAGIDDLGTRVQVYSVSYEELDELE